MPNCDFYAAGEDFRSILNLVFAQPNWTLVESSSVPDQPLRRFQSADGLLGAYDLDRTNASMQLYTPALGGGIVERPIVFRPGAVGNAKGRTDSAGWGLIQLYLNAAREGSIAVSHTNHNSEVRAREWESIYRDELGPVEAWNWREVVRTSQRLNRFIRALAVSRSGSRVMLPIAASRAIDGAVLSLN